MVTQLLPFVLLVASGIVSAAPLAKRGDAVIMGTMMMPGEPAKSSAPVPVPSSSGPVPSSSGPIPSSSGPVSSSSEPVSSSSGPVPSSSGPVSSSSGPVPSSSGPVLSSSGPVSSPVFSSSASSAMMTAKPSMKMGMSPSPCPESTTISLMSEPAMGTGTTPSMMDLSAPAPPKATEPPRMGGPPKMNKSTPSNQTGSTSCGSEKTVTMTVEKTVEMTKTVTVPAAGCAPTSPVKVGTTPTPPKMKETTMGMVGGPNTPMVGGSTESNTPKSGEPKETNTLTMMNEPNETSTPVPTSGMGMGMGYGKKWTSL